MRQDNTIYKYSIKLSFSSVGQEKSKLQKQISKLLILIATAAWYFSLPSPPPFSLSLKITYVLCFQALNKLNSYSLSFSHPPFLTPSLPPPPPSLSKLSLNQMSCFQAFNKSISYSLLLPPSSPHPLSLSLKIRWELFPSSQVNFILCPPTLLSSPLLTPPLSLSLFLSLSLSLSIRCSLFPSTQQVNFLLSPSPTLPSAPLLTRSLSWSPAHAPYSLPSTSRAPSAWSPDPPARSPWFYRAGLRSASRPVCWNRFSQSRASQLRVAFVGRRQTLKVFPKEIKINVWIALGGIAPNQVIARGSFHKAILATVDLSYLRLILQWPALIFKRKLRWLRKKGRKEMFFLTTHSTHFIYGYMALDIW